MKIEEIKDESFRDTASTFDKLGKRIWMFPTKPKGFYTKLRTILALFLLAIFFGMPFIRINGDPLFMLNIIERKFIIFGATFYPQDFFIFGLAMLCFILFIVLFTVVFGRLWCGWACPQTVFMEMVFRKIEFWIEGDGVHQRALKKAPWNREKIIKKTSKHAIFFLISFTIANTFLAYIISADELFRIMSEPVQYHIGGLISLVIFTGVFYWVFAFFREQACIVVCPYGRLQGVLLDRDSIVVAYDYERGEPRGKFSKLQDEEKGDCIDCFQCVKVCPTGIDIRNGTQLECVNCTACMDACDFMMEKVGKPTGLIRYASERNIAEKKKLRLSPRIIGYSAVLALLLTLLSFSMFTRNDIETKIVRTPGLLYQERGNDSISNLFHVKIMNKGLEKMAATIKLEDANGEIVIVGQKKQIEAARGKIGEAEIFIILPNNELKKRKTTLTIGVYSGGEKLEEVETTFIAPVGANFQDK